MLHIEIESIKIIAVTAKDLILPKESFNFWCFVTNIGPNTSGSRREWKRVDPDLGPTS